MEPNKQAANQVPLKKTVIPLDNLPIKKPEVPVVKSDPTAPLPIMGGRKPEQDKAVELQTGKEKDGCLLLMYIMFKENLLTNHNLKHMIHILNGELPKEGVAKYLVNEAAKAS